MAMIGGHDDAGVAQEAVEAASGVEHRAEGVVDALDDREGGMRTNLVADKVVVGEVGDGQIGERVIAGKVASNAAGRSIVHAEPMHGATLVVSELRPRGAPDDEVAQAEQRGPDTVRCSGTPGSRARSHGTFTECVTSCRDGRGS